MNVCVFSGNIGKDSELRYTGGGIATASFSLAVNNGFGDRKTTFWVRCQLWEKQAETLNPMLLKGVKVIVAGELNNREWTDKEGVKRWSLELNVNRLDFAERKSSAPEPGSILAGQEEQDSIPF